MHDGASFSFAVLYLITKRICSCVKFSEDGEMLPEWGAENVATISWFFFQNSKSFPLHRVLNYSNDMRDAYFQTKVTFVRQSLWAKKLITMHVTVLI